MNYTKLESEQDYLERILMIEKEKGKVKSIDIAKGLNFSKPSVSIAMRKLKDEDLIDIDTKGYISLTEKGREIAMKVYERHTTLTSIFVKLGVSEEQSEQDACKIEHDLSDDVYNALKKHFINDAN